MHSHAHTWNLVKLLAVLLIPAGIVLIVLGELWLLSMPYSSFYVHHADFWKVSLILGALLLVTAYWTHRDAEEEATE